MLMTELPATTEPKTGLRMPANVPSQTAPLAPPAPPESCVRLRDFNAWYGDFHVLHDINIEVPEKNVTAFIGPSG
jgi:hypothetical protein